MADADFDPTNLERAETEQPRFIQAVLALEQFLNQSDQASQAAYFANKTMMPFLAQNFDLIAGPNPIPIEGDTTKLKEAAAFELKQAIDEYRGPVEIRQIYIDFYYQQISEILGE